MDDTGPFQTETVDSDAVRRYLVFHDTLNPKIWVGDRLRLEVRVHLLRAALAFFRFLDMPELKLDNVILTGSNAAYNYTDLSDLDVHIVVDYSRTPFGEMAGSFFNAKKALWNQTHDVSVRGYNVELYVEDSREPVKANGIYSLMHGEWLSEPSRAAPKWNDSDVIAKVDDLADQIDALLGSPDQNAVEAMLEKLYTMRKSGLAAGGEFSVENLAFKGLRNLGYLDQLRQAKLQAQDQTLSLEGQQ